VVQKNYQHQKYCNPIEICMSYDPGIFIQFYSVLLF
jgi:hypothetical protein